MSNEDFPFCLFGINLKLGYIRVSHSILELPELETIERFFIVCLLRKLQKLCHTGTAMENTLNMLKAEQRFLMLYKCPTSIRKLTEIKMKKDNINLVFTYDYSYVKPVWEIAKGV